MTCHEGNAIVSDNRNRAVVTGITGQDGAYLAQLLLAKGYTVYGTYRRTSSVNFWRLDELDITHHPTSISLGLTFSSPFACWRKPSRRRSIRSASFVGVFEQPITTAEITGVGALNLLEAIRTVDPAIRFIRHRRRRCLAKCGRAPIESTPFTS